MNPLEKSKNTQERCSVDTKLPVNPTDTLRPPDRRPDLLIEIQQTRYRIQMMWMHVVFLRVIFIYSICCVYVCVICIFIYSICINIYIYMICSYLFCCWSFVCFCYFINYYLVIRQEVKVVLIHTPVQLVAVMYQTVDCQPPIDWKDEEEEEQCTLPLNTTEEEVEQDGARCAARVAETIPD